MSKQEQTAIITSVADQAALAALVSSNSQVNVGATISVENMVKLGIEPFIERCKQEIRLGSAKLAQLQDQLSTLRAAAQKCVVDAAQEAGKADQKEMRDFFKKFDLESRSPVNTTITLIAGYSVVSKDTVVSNLKLGCVATGGYSSGNLEFAREYKFKVPGLSKQLADIEAMEKKVDEVSKTLMDWKTQQSEIPMRSQSITNAITRVVMSSSPAQNAILQSIDRKMTEVMAKMDIKSFEE